MAGAIPLIRPLRESLAGERIQRVMGIVNGTTNYILTRMSEDGVDYAEALAEAQSLGYAESDATADVEGHDASAKAAILASIAFGQDVVTGDVYREGITAVSPADIAFAGQLGYEIKLLAVAERVDEAGVGGDGGSTDHLPSIAVRVHPAMVPRTHPLASVRDSFNAVFIEGEAVGELMLYGRGAGGRPTASAVLGDLIDAAHNLRAGGGGRVAVRSPRASTPSTSCAPSTTSTSTCWIDPGCSQRWRRCSASTGSRSARWSRSGSATRPASCSSRTRLWSATCRRRSTGSPGSMPSSGSAACSGSSERRWGRSRCANPIEGHPRPAGGG